MTTKDAEVLEWLDEAATHLDKAASALIAASVRTDWRTASAITRVLDAVDRAKASIPFVDNGEG